MAVKKYIKDRFIKKIKKTRSCWIWLGSTSNRGYGGFRYGGKWAKAHRISYIIFKGRIIKNLFVLHKCDNRSCVNPDHLFLGTALDNYNDMIKKNRRIYRKSAITDIQKYKVPILFKNGHKVSSLAIRFNVGQSTIKRIINDLS